jgi:hypothetical protein
MNVTTVQTCPVARKPLRARPRARGARHSVENAIGRPLPAPADSLARARADRIIAERHLIMAIKRAELRYEETAELGMEFDRHLERTKSALRDAGYLRA